MKEHLLELLATECGCFISSLPGMLGSNQLLLALHNVSYSNFPPEEWDYCLSYLLHREVSLSNAGELEQLLSTLGK